MCRRMIINSGITRVVNRIGDDGIEIIDVQNWIVNDESIQPKAEAESARFCFTSAAMLIIISKLD